MSKLQRSRSTRQRRITASKTRPSRPRNPQTAWIIVAVGWEYNDEVTYPMGETPHCDLFFELATAEAECRRLCDEFFAAQTPAEFELDWEQYLPDDYPMNSFDATAIGWEQVRAMGFPDPYYVLQLNHHESQSS